MSVDLHPFLQYLTDPERPARVRRVIEENTADSRERLRELIGAGKFACVGRWKEGTLVKRYHRQTESRVPTTVQDAFAQRILGAPRYWYEETVDGEPRGLRVVMDEIIGVTLSELIARDGRKRPTLSAPTRLRLAYEALGLCARLKEADTSHGDFKPENSIVSIAGMLSPIDFDGVASLQNPNAHKRFYTLSYCAPERLDMLSLPTSDLYSAGCLMLDLELGEHWRNKRDDLTKEGHTAYRRSQEYAKDLRRSINRIAQPQLREVVSTLLNVSPESRGDPTHLQSELPTQDMATQEELVEEVHQVSAFFAHYRRLWYRSQGLSEPRG